MTTLDTRIVWFRRDLRLHDHEALSAAIGDATEDRRVVPLFVLDPRLVGAATMSPARLAYLCDALRDLDEGLRERGARLVLRRGDPRAVVADVAEEVRAGEVHWLTDVTPYAQARDAEVSKALEAAGVVVETHPGVLMRDPDEILGADGSHYKVYSPFRRAWERERLPEAQQAPKAVPVHGSVGGEDLPDVEEFGVDDRVPDDLPRGGETEALRRLDTFLEGSAGEYHQQRDMLARAGTSRLSADLHYGCLSPRAAYQRLDRRRPGHRGFGQELVWRDFYGQVMAAWPEVRDTEFDASYRDLPWRGEGELFDAWREARTGYPIVDAAMRQLHTIGWMHNRARMVVASFLCKHLRTDWRLGQDHFLSHLVDGDVSSNNGGWQWAAGTGTDAMPYFRIFNPVLQGQKFDPGGDYVRCFIPELAVLPDKYVHQPWALPEKVAGELGFELGRDYPEPIVEHKQARAEALEWFKQHKRP